MANLNELTAKIKEDAAFAAKFADCKNADEFIEIAKKEGYEVTVEEIEKLTDMSADDLTDSAGGTGPGIIVFSISVTAF